MSGLGPGAGSGSGLGLGLGLGFDFVAPCGKRRQPVESELPTYGDTLGKVGRRGRWEKQMGAQSGGAAGEERRMACTMCWHICVAKARRGEFAVWWRARRGD